MKHTDNKPQQKASQAVVQINIKKARSSWSSGWVNWNPPNTAQTFNKVSPRYHQLLRDHISKTVWVTVWNTSFASSSLVPFWVALAPCMHKSWKNRREQQWALWVWASTFLHHNRSTSPAPSQAAPPAGPLSAAQGFGADLPPSERALCPLRSPEWCGRDFPGAGRRLRRRPTRPPSQHQLATGEAAPRWGSLWPPRCEGWQREQSATAQTPTHRHF